MAKKTIKNATIDTKFSKLIRERDDYICQMPECKFCENHSLRSGGAECSHYRGRRYLAGRWHPDNCITLCHPAHAEIDQGPQALHVRLMIRVLGETRHDMLVERLQRTFKYPQWERLLRSCIESPQKGMSIEADLDRIFFAPICPGIWLGCRGRS